MSPEQMLAEVAKIQYLYGLKYEIRYADNRHEDDTTESVAEHVYGMHILCQYFLPLEDPSNSWSKHKILDMITLHDIDEIETGDMIGYHKTAAQRDAEADAMHIVINKSPSHMQEHMKEILSEYNAQVTPEARFVKAIDRFEPQIHLFGAKGKAILHKHKTTREQNRSLREKILNPYPHMYAFYRAIEEKMFIDGYFDATE
jgi:putative hydrolase of HD superfamily